jgi:trimeric autotransporter adhesin
MKKLQVTYFFLLIILLFPIVIFSQNWLPLDKGIGKTWADIHYIFPDSNCIYVSGNFTDDGNNIPMRGIAKWDGTKWDSVGDANKFNATKSGIFKYRDTLFTSGIFYDSPHVSFAKIKGGIWEPFSDSRDLEVSCFLEKDGILYLGGYFYKCGNDSTNLIGKYDGTSFSGMTPVYEDPLSSSVVECIAFFQDTLYVGGNFYLYPKLPIAGFAKWDGTNLVQVSPEFNNTTCSVHSIAVYKDELYIGGDFKKADGFTGDNLMKWDGHQLSEVGGGTNYQVNCMEVYNNELYIGGVFTVVGGITSKNIAKWNGNQWTSLNNDDFDEVICVKDFCIYKGELYVAGYFRKIGNDSISSIAKYNHSLLSIKNISGNENYFSIFPNPFTTSTSFQLSVPLLNATFIMYDILGKEVKCMYNLNGTEIKISREGIQNGMYFFTLFNSEKLIGTGKMIID